MDKATLLRAKVEKLVGLLTEKSVKVTQRGDVAFTSYDETGKPVSVNIPEIPNGVTDEFVSAVEGYIDHEVSHVLFTDFEYLNKSYEDESSKKLFNAIEDAFVEKKIIEKFSGSNYNITRLGEFVINKNKDKQYDKGLLMLFAFRAWGNIPVYKRFMEDKWHHISDFTAKVGAYASKAIPEIQSSKDTFEVMTEIKRLLQMPEQKKQSDGEDSSDENGDGSSQNEEQQQKGGNADGKGQKRRTKNDKQQEEQDNENQGQQDDKTQEGKQEQSNGKNKSKSRNKKGQSGDEKEQEDMLNQMKDFTEEMVEAINSEIKEQSENFPYKVYTREFDKFEVINSEGAIDKIAKMESEVAPMLGAIQKRLERLISAKSMAQWSGGYRSGKMNATALSRLVVKNDDRIFKRKHISDTKDTAVSLLIDCSGSMRNGKINTACYTAFGLSSVLERMNINHEVLGFTTGHDIDYYTKIPKEYDFQNSRMETVVTYVFKEFKERLTPIQKGRFAVGANNMLEQMCCNADNESVRIASERLLQQKQKRKILIVLSDGRPNSSGRVDFERELKNIVKRIEQETEIEIVGIGIQSSAVKKFYKNHVVINSVSELPTTVMQELQKLLLK